MSEIPADIKTIFAEALEKQTPAERSAYLNMACRGDAALRQRVEALLQAHEESDDVPDAPIVSLDLPREETSLTECPGTVIGRYKLLEKIGEGGMAVVYMAEQEQPIRRKVALKIIKLGMDTRQVIARFEAERQALALMDHPSIAKVLDAGATETGRPYFVMELVQGVSITEYCDRNNLSTKDRLALFLQVCQAVQHAHQKGIIHRDIKPSNVMVTHHDGKPVPKVIDFGIAKATNQRLTEKTLFTRYAHIIGTPAYMSPEQAELSDLDVDTRTDIYSLGVLLYELLTGTTPFSEEELRKAGYLEMQRVIREQEPVRPSVRLTTLGETLTDVAKHRASTPDLLRKAVRGDLDWIVLKSLEKNRDRRYDHVSTLAMDVERHLADEPVSARAPTIAYRLHKLLRKHRARAVRMLVLALLVSTLVVVVSLWNQYRLRLTEAEAAKHRDTLSRASGQFARTQHGAALETLSPILANKHVGTEARLLHERILNDVREKVGYYTHKIETDPKDAQSYLGRAQQYHYLQEHEKVYADMDHYAAVLGQEWFSGIRFGPLTNLGPAINGATFEYGARLSDDGLCLHFQRVGGDVVSVWRATRATKGDPWHAAVNFGSPAKTDDFPAIYRSSGNRLEIYWGWGSPDIDLWMMQRETVNADWGPPINLGPAINTSVDEVGPVVSSDGLELYFSRYGAPAGYVPPVGCGRADLWVAKRAARNALWGEPVNLGPTVNSESDDGRPYLSADGLLLFFDSRRPGGYGSGDLYVTRRANLSAPWGKPVNLGPVVNSPAFEEWACLSADGATLYWDCWRPGGCGSNDIWQVSVTGLGNHSKPNGRTDDRQSGGEAEKKG